MINSSVNDKEWVTRFSSLTRLQRVMANVYRFIRHTRTSCIMNGPLTLVELQNALTPIIKIIQQQYFGELIKTLQKPDTNISPRSLAQLAPFLDEKMVIRVGGRLRNSQLSEESRHPILLPKTSELTILIIRHFHINHFHAGTQLVSTLIARRYWILSGRLSIRNVIYKCVVCARHKANTPQPFMADLPSIRVTPARSFLHVGIDFAGPLLIKESRRRNARSSKSYLAVFVCMVIKSVHLEVVSDLSTDAFIASLHRFIARRGIPSDIYTDCGSNFKGVDQQLRQLFETSTLKDQFSKAVPCKWHFNPPAAPHFGGLWEAAVKSAKYHLKRVVGEQILTFEEMSTLTSRIEAILNSRPLTPFSSDPHDYRPLTSGDFLIGAPLVAIPEPNILSVPKNRLNRWELLRQLHQSFWKRWSMEYLTLLQGRTKWTHHQPNVQPDDLVLLISPNQPPTQWSLGKIERTHPGTDGVVRVATVRTTNGTFVRPIVKLVLLSIDKSP